MGRQRWPYRYRRTRKEWSNTYTHTDEETHIQKGTTVSVGRKKWEGFRVGGEEQYEVLPFSLVLRNRARPHTTIFLVCTWFVPLPLCDHSQGVYFPSQHRRRSIVFRVLFQETNKQTNKPMMLLVDRNNVFQLHHLQKAHPLTTWS